MSEIVVRRLLVDLEHPLARHWCGGDAFRTAFMNSLSMAFTEGEQFFIQAMRQGFAALPADKQGAWQAEVEAYIGQEATHRKLHCLFNEHLERQGLVNNWGRRSAKRRLRIMGVDPRIGLAITAGYEHLTAVIARFFFAYPHVLDGCEERLRDLWLWHAAEEAEHKCSPFDLYYELGGNLEHRRLWYRRVSILFTADLIRQTTSNLWRDGSLFKPDTWTSGARFLFGEQGLIRLYFRHWTRYRAIDFHPGEDADTPAREWLATHSDAYVVVRRHG